MAGLPGLFLEVVIPQEWWTAGLCWKSSVRMFLVYHKSMATTGSQYTEATYCQFWELQAFL